MEDQPSVSNEEKKKRPGRPRKTKEPTVLTPFLIPMSIRKALEDRAEAEGTSMAAIVMEALRKHLGEED
jgi:hypothetical protein